VIHARASRCPASSSRWQTAVIDAVAAFDPARGTWTDGPVLPVPVHDVTSTVEALPIGD
jgi:hypothetical protein